MNCMLNIMLRHKIFIDSHFLLRQFYQFNQISIFLCMKYIQKQLNKKSLFALLIFKSINQGFQFLLIFKKYNTTLYETNVLQRLNVYLCNYCRTTVRGYYYIINKPQSLTIFLFECFFYREKILTGFPYFALRELKPKPYF